MSVNISKQESNVVFVEKYIGKLASYETVHIHLLRKQVAQWIDPIDI